MSNRYISILILTLGLSVGLRAQTQDSRILRLVKEQNLTIASSKAQSQSQTLQARTGNSLSDPKVEYSFSKGASSDLGSENEITATQGFDFPTVYTAKNSAAKLRGHIYDLDYRKSIEDVSVEALQTIARIRNLRALDSMLSKRYADALFAMKVYQKRLSAGAATAIEENKITMELLSAESRLKSNRIEISSENDVLALLCGGQRVDVAQKSDMNLNLADIGYILEEAKTKDLSLKNYQSQLDLSHKEKKIAVSSALPKFEVGYKRQWNSSSERFNGLVAGISIPIFESRNTVRAAKAQVIAANAAYSQVNMTVFSDLQSKYHRASTLAELLESYSKVVDIEKKSSILQKALDAGQISILEYFVEQVVLYDTLEMYLGLKTEYDLLLVELNKYSFSDF